MTNNYMFRSFDQLGHGQSYADIQPLVHIGILDHTLFADYPEFYTKYRFLYIKNHKIYNDNFALNVLDLRQIHLAKSQQE